MEPDVGERGEERSQIGARQSGVVPFDLQRLSPLHGRKVTMNLIPIGHIVNAVVIAFLGILVFTIAFVVLDKLTPYHLWKEVIQEHNIALAILVGALSIGICIIIAAAVH